jgi:putative transposase
VPTRSGTVHVAFAIDVFSRRIVDWKADTSMRTALEMTLWTCGHTGHPITAGLTHHSYAGLAPREAGAGTRRQQGRRRDQIDPGR